MGFTINLAGNLIILLFTAILTGLLLPMILGRIEDHKQKQQMEFRVRLMLQNRVIRAQSRLLDDLSQLLWDFQLSALAVSYYKVWGTDAEYQAALERYEANVWLLFGSIRTEISKATRLTLPATHQALLTFYKELMALDGDLMRMVRGESSKEEWEAHHSRFHQQAGEKTDAIIALLADEWRLSSDSILEQIP